MSRLAQREGRSHHSHAAWRVGVAQVSCESNHFTISQGALELFQSSGYLEEGARLLRLATTPSEIGGALSEFAAAPDVQVAPLLAARGTLSGPLSSACYHELKRRFLNHLQAALPLDGLFVSHHGSLCADDVDDTEGNLLAAARELVGPAVPIVVTVDLHANITRQMVEAANLIVGYKHYPHDDVRETGQRAARLLLRTLRREIMPTMVYVKLPMLLTAFHASTATGGPFGDLMERTLELETTGQVLSSSVFFVGSYIDLPEVGCGALAITDDDPAGAEASARSLAEEFWGTRGRFAVETCSVAEAVRRGRAIPGGPVLLLDTADTVGGGSSGDGAGLIRGLLENQVTEPSLAMVVDPAAAAVCVSAGPGQTVSVALGHHVDSRWGQPVPVTGVVRRVTAGRFQYGGGIFGGTTVTMGPSAVLECGNLQILVMSLPTYDWAREQYELLGLDVRQFKFVGVKNMMNFRVGYRDVMKGFFVLDLPGPTPADMRQLPFRRIPRPLYPFDELETPPAFAVTRSAPLRART